MARHTEFVAELEIADDAVLRDFDTMESLTTLPKSMRREGLGQAKRGVTPPS